MTINDVVKSYYKFRKYKQPDAMGALLWLISEVGELAEAHMTIPFYQHHANRKEKLALWLMIKIGKFADRLVSMRGGWVRNNGRKTDDVTPIFKRIKNETGDILMMLTVYAENFGYDPVGCMLEKMEEKGFKEEFIYGLDQEPAG